MDNKKFCLFIFFFFLTSFSFQKVVAQSIAFDEPANKPILLDLHYGNRIGGLIGQEAPTEELIILRENDILQKIQVFTNTKSGLVSGFIFTVLLPSKQSKTLTFGQISGQAQQEILLKNRKITGVSGTYGWFIDSLQFHFSDGTTSPKYGGNGGDLTFNQSFNRNKTGHVKGKFCGIYGSFTDQLESIGLVFWAKE